MNRPILAGLLVGVALFALPACRLTPENAHHHELTSWNHGASREAIEDFVLRVTDLHGADYVEPAERIAVFDNDGCLWAEQPVYFQLLFAIDRVNALAPEHPEWRTEEPFRSVLRKDMQSVMAGGHEALGKLIAATHAGMTTDEFSTIVADWLATARHPTTGRPYTEMVYQPMLELLGYLRAHGFKTFIVSGGGVDFMRVFAEQTYGIPPEQVVGSAGAVEFEMRDDGPVLKRLPELVHNDDKEGKPVGIHQRIGRRPIAAFGNSDGDHQMLQWTAAGDGPSLCALVHHTDADREWAYDRGSPIGGLDKALDEALARGWLVIDMAADWSTVFAGGER